MRASPYRAWRHSAGPSNQAKNRAKLICIRRARSSAWNCPVHSPAFPLPRHARPIFLRVWADRQRRSRMSASLDVAGRQNSGAFKHCNVRVQYNAALSFSGASIAKRPTTECQHGRQPRQGVGSTFDRFLLPAVPRPALPQKGPLALRVPSQSAPCSTTFAHRDSALAVLALRSDKSARLYQQPALDGPSSWSKDGLRAFLSSGTRSMRCRGCLRLRPRVPHHAPWASCIVTAYDSPKQRALISKGRLINLSENASLKAREGSTSETMW